MHFWSVITSFMYTVCKSSALILVLVLFHFLLVWIQKHCPSPSSLFSCCDTFTGLNVLQLFSSLWILNFLINVARRVIWIQLTVWSYFLQKKNLPVFNSSIMRFYLFEYHLTSLASLPWSFRQIGWYSYPYKKLSWG
jgi:hypothetical protein